MPDPFDRVVAEERLHPNFVQVRDHATHAPTRGTIRDAFGTYDDPDGNFLEQFQTTGFDARVWELYLDVAFKSMDFDVSRPDRPDFMLAKAGESVATEAVTSNPTQGAEPLPAPITEEELANRQRHYVPMRLGSALYSKLNMKYWELPHVHGKPLVLAIEPFFGPDALDYSDATLMTYLYGRSAKAAWDARGKLQQATEKVQTHRHGKKEIPSGFFNLPHAEFISAVLFSNSGTIAKFQRVAQEGNHRSQRVMMARIGACYDHDPEAAVPLAFDYIVGSRPQPETWGEGLSLIHNPHALHPLDRDLFREIAQTRLDKDGTVWTESPDFYPFVSTTFVADLGSAGAGFPHVGPVSAVDGTPIVKVSKVAFEIYCLPRIPTIESLFREDEWFMDHLGRVCGMVLFDIADRNWSVMILGRDERAFFRAIDFEINFTSQDDAKADLVRRMEKAYTLDTAVFPQ